MGPCLTGHVVLNWAIFEIPEIEVYVPGKIICTTADEQGYSFGLDGVDYIIIHSDDEKKHCLIEHK